MNCTKCGAPLAAHFKVEYVGRDGAVATSAALCSLVCLLGWGQDFVASAGMRVALGVQQKIDTAKRAFGALKSIFKGS